MIKDTETLTPDMEAALAGMLGCTPDSVEWIGGGGNSRIFKLASGSNHYAAKFYFRHKKDKRDRLGTEFSALKFLRENGLKCVPVPVIANSDLGIGIYEFIEGQRIPPGDAGADDVDSAVRFVGALKGLGPKGISLAPASEACFSVNDIVENIGSRLERLFNAEGGGEQHEEMGRYLKDDFVPAFNEITQWCEKLFLKLGESTERRLESSEMILSPSDFGFHNALRRNSDGNGIVFLDFEYFGWDDPAKLIADFILHPAMDLSLDLKQRFVSNALSIFEDSKVLAERLKGVYPLFGLKWCMIMLNEFVPEDIERRRFSSRAKGDFMQTQLSKAKGMLTRIMREYEDFPYRRGMA